MSQEAILFEKINGKIQKEVSTIEAKAHDLQHQIDKLNEKYDHSMITPNSVEKSVFMDTVLKAMKDNTGDLKKHGKVSTELVIKSGPEAMGTTTTTGAGVIIGDREPGIHSEPKRRPSILSAIATGTTDSDSVTWVERTNEQGEPAFKKEFETMPLRSWETVERKAYVKKIGVTSEYSREILEDLDGFQNEVRRDLLEKVNLLLDNELLNGTGGAEGDATIKGILEHAQSWDSGTTKVDDPSIYDVIAVGANQIEVEHHTGNTVCMHPTTYLEMSLTKDKEGKYLQPPFSTGRVISGLNVITTTLFNPGELLIMDSQKAKYFFRRAWTLEMTDSHDDNFTKDVITVKLTGRGVLRIKNTDAKAFVFVSDINAAISALAGS